jgi:hypothetical protein
MENEIKKLLEAKGPQTGSELAEVAEMDSLLLWRFCMRDPELILKPVGTKYMRLDRRVDGFARLSPSILREFLTYTVIGLSKDEIQVAEKAQAINLHIEQISKAKSELAYRIVSALETNLDTEISLADQTCFIIAGDIVYNMAHDVPRPERSTGKLVQGSDMDLVVIVNQDFSEEMMKRLDDMIFQEKYRLLSTPHIREEIDYIVKKPDRVKEQMRFDTFKHMLACKILKEGTRLYGSEDLFHSIKDMLREYGVIQKLLAMEKQALEFRKTAIDYLLKEDPEKIKQESLFLFYPTEESEEFE